MRRVKKTTKSTIKRMKFALGEHIRVVPLHHPEPPISIAELSRVRREREAETVDFFDGAEYSVPGQAIGRGSFIGTKVISANAPAGSVSDSAIRAQLKQWIAGTTVPKNTKNTLYFIFLDPGIVSIMGGGRSCQSYCGYHNNVGKVYYGVMPYPTCSGCLGGMQAFDALTGTSSHELCEAITDPVPGSGWYDDTNGEIGDICAWTFKQVAGYTVQLEWSNQQNKCV